MPETNDFVSINRIERAWREGEEAQAYIADELRQKGLATYEFRAFVTVLATDDLEAERVAEDALEDISGTHVRASLDDGSPDVSDPEDF